MAYRVRLKALCAYDFCGTAGVVDVLLTPAEIAERWHVRRARIYELIHLGALPVVRIGRQLRIPQPALEAFVAAGGWRKPAAGEQVVSA
jgi:excisionase family DNA binding protein